MLPLPKAFKLVRAVTVVPVLSVKTEPLNLFLFVFAKDFISLIGIMLASPAALLTASSIDVNFAPATLSKSLYALFQASNKSELI